MGRKRSVRGRGGEGLGEKAGGGKHAGLEGENWGNSLQPEGSLEEWSSCRGQGVCSAGSESSEAVRAWRLRPMDGLRTLSP